MDFECPQTVPSTASILSIWVDRRVESGNLILGVRSVLCTADRSVLRENMTVTGMTAEQIRTSCGVADGAPLEVRHAAGIGVPIFGGHLVIGLGHARTADAQPDLQSIGETGTAADAQLLAACPAGGVGTVGSRGRSPRPAADGHGVASGGYRQTQLNVAGRR